MGERKLLGALRLGEEHYLHHITTSSWYNNATMPALPPDQVEAAVFAHLAALGVAYEKIACDPDLADTAAFCDHYGFPPRHSGNTIVVATQKQPKKYCVCVVTATSRLDVNRTVRRLLDGGKCSFASADETMEITSMMIGGVTPFALPDNLPIFVDEQLMALDYVIVGAGSRSAKVKISPGVFRQLPGAQIIPDLSRPRTD